MWGENITETEREQALKEHNLKQEKMIKTGKILVFIFAAYHIFGTVFSAVFSFDIVVMAVRIIFIIVLLLGHTWVKYLLAVFSGLSALIYAFLLLGGVLDFTDAVNKELIIAALVIEMLMQIVCCVMLFSSKSITEYMYFKKNG